MKNIKLSTKVIEDFKNIPSASKQDRQNCLKALEILKIDKDSIFGQFSLLTYSISNFDGINSQMIDNTCYYVNTFDYYMDYLNNNNQILNLPPEYIIIGDFDGEGGFFYNRKTGEVLELDLRDLKDFHAGKLKPQFKDFNTFLEWFFELN